MDVSSIPDKFNKEQDPKSGETKGEKK